MKDLLSERGSVFVQIGIENIHIVKNVLDEIFGSKNFISLINFSTTTLTSKYLDRAGDYIIWYAKNKEELKYRDLFIKKDFGKGTPFNWVEFSSGERRVMTEEEQDNPSLLPKGSKIFGIHYDLLSSGYTQSCMYDFEFEGRYMQQEVKVGKQQKMDVEFDKE